MIAIPLEFTILFWKLIILVLLPVLWRVRLRDLIRRILRILIQLILLKTWQLSFAIVFRLDVPHVVFLDASTSLIYLVHEPTSRFILQRLPTLQMLVPRLSILLLLLLFEHISELGRSWQITVIIKRLLFDTLIVWLIVFGDFIDSVKFWSLTL
jgi:hypothetical protein